MLYLKYRPLTISQLDNTEIRLRMEAVAVSTPLPHAFLLVGPKGTGKTSTARILAKVANCPQVAINKDVCGKCEVCTRIASGAAMDLVEIDAASNRGIDDIRSLREKVNLLPSELTRKVYIIDEVHMLTREAFNALLKTLEEPPAHVVFVLCTTEPEKVPPTIRSRCLEIKFRRATRRDLISKLFKVAKGEEIEITKAAVEIIADEAGGSFRDGIKLLEQLAEGRDKLDEKWVEKELRAYLNSADKLYEVMLAGELKEGLEAIDRVLADEIEVVKLLQSMANRAVEEAASGYLAGDAEAVVKLKMELSQVLVEAYAEYQKLPNSELVLKRLALSWFAASKSSVQKMTKGTVIMKEPETKTVKPEVSVVSSVIRSKPRAEKSKKSAEKKMKTIELADRKSSRREIKTKKVIANKMELAEAVKMWDRVMEAVKPQNHSVSALLRSAKIVAVEGKVFKVEVFYRFHKDRLESTKCRQIVDTSLVQLVGDGYRVEYFLGQKPRLNSKTSEQKNAIDGGTAVLESDRLLDMAEEILGS